MKEDESLYPDKQDVLAAVRQELATGGSKATALRERLDEVRWAIDGFRSEPVGGRLQGVKAIAFWFVASSFDRQTKILESMVDLLGETVGEIERRSPEASKE